MTKNAVFVSRRALEGLPADVRTALMEASARAEARGYELSRDSQTQAEATLGQRGMQVLQPSEQLLADLRRVSQQMTQEWIERAGEDGKRLIEAYLAAR
jgi:TRAP-type C4-dicarboxylate transport system substrate-binding protein